MGALSWEFLWGLVLVLSLELVQCFLVFPRQGSFGLLAAVAVPLDLSPKTVYMAFNFESNYALPSNDSYNQWIDRWQLYEPFMGVPGNVTPINARQQASEDLVTQEENKEEEGAEVRRRSVGSPPPFRRRDFYLGIMNYLSHYGFNGSACLLRVICEVSEAPLDAHNGLVGSLFQILFMPTTSAAEEELQHVDALYEATDAGTRGLGCSDYVANCGHSALDLISVVL
ncbi:uncharacterized protein [Drosophila kikkawai]|uniref:Uncharacterized protein n=1 Tax=Drosophila kikkawai TaxID=30033 RepID=A0A6P4IJI8_DROKI|nr:uncharacterized protein LOC108075146 [Drosophila kikkawai]